MSGFFAGFTCLADPWSLGMQAYMVQETTDLVQSLLCGLYQKIE